MTPDKPEMPELLPCPFCGTEPEGKTNEHGFSDIVCRNEKCRIRPVVCDYKEVAYAAWNHRAPSPAAGEVDVEALKKEIAEKVCDCENVDCDLREGAYKAIYFLSQRNLIATQPEQGSAWQPIEAIKQLRDHQKQLDADGIMVGVSRQAIDEVLGYIEAIANARAGGG